MEFVFQISSYHAGTLQKQISWALQKRTELSSRRHFPRIWKVTDYMQKRAKPKAASFVRTLFYKLGGLILCALGIFLLVPGLLEPQELLVPLLTGAVSTGIGLLYLFPPRISASKKFQKAAIKLLAPLQAVDADTLILVSFTDQGMTIGNQPLIPYAQFDTIVETADLYLFTWQKHVTVLQKRDLVKGSEQAFVQLLTERTVSDCDYFVQHVTAEDNSSN